MLLFLQTRNQSYNELEFVKLLNIFVSQCMFVCVCVCEILCEGVWVCECVGAWVGVGAFSWSHGKI